MVLGASKMADMPAPLGHFIAGLTLHITKLKPILFFDNLFSNEAISRANARARRRFEGVFAALFGLHGHAKSDHALDSVT